MRLPFWLPDSSSIQYISRALMIVSFAQTHRAIRHRASARMHSDAASLSFAGVAEFLVVALVRRPTNESSEWT
jgi:hypothetical protein